MSLNSISPIDGRYAGVTAPLSTIFSERGFMRYRIIVEGEYLIALSESDGVSLRKFTKKEKEIVRNLYNLKLSGAEIISKIEKKGYKKIKATDHDTKAVEYFIKERLARTSLEDVLEWIHFGLTSEDTINIAYGLMLREGTDSLLGHLDKVVKNIAQLAKKHSSLAMLARTHGQSASPTTFGKEFMVFASRLKRQIGHLSEQEILCKLNGATGNYNAHVVAFPDTNWVNFSKKYIQSLSRSTPGTLKLVPNLYTTQIEPHDSCIEIFDNIRRINTILLDFNQDIWRYISDEWIVQKPIGSVGSSTMPHKINPIKFENSEGNLGMANAMFEFFARKLPISRLQRDLSDSTVSRNIGVAFAHSFIGYEYLQTGLASIEVNKKKILEDLNAHPEVITEAIQTILRRERVPMPYEKLKELSRGKQISMDDIHKFIDELDVSTKVRNELWNITPESYTGLAPKMSTL